MGKSSKKAKSERINALRKQYEAFLEEDQKRKKRNEYILGQLDKMRFTTALVPVRVKVDRHPSEVHDVGYHPDSASSHNYRSSNTTSNSIFPDIETNNGDQFLIQEICKKYILIPKRRSSFIDNSIQSVILNQNPDRLLPVQNIPVKDVKASQDENVDWKSKYDILNLLKNEEKESVNNNTRVDSELQVNKGCLLNNPHEAPTNNYSNIINTDGQITPSTKFLNELPEKELAKTFLKYDSNYNIENNGNVVICLNKISDKKAYDCNEEAITYSDPKDNIDYELEQLKLDYTNADEKDAKLTCSPIAEIKNYESQPKINVNTSSIDTDIPTVKKADKTFTENANMECGYSIGNDSPVYVQSVSEEQDLKALAQTIKLENQIIPTPTINATDIRQNLDHPSHDQAAINPEVGEIQEFTSYPDVETITNVNQLDQIGVQHVDDKMYEYDEKEESVVIEDGNTVDVAGSIDEFNAEQEEMFYSEHTEQNAMYAPDMEQQQNHDFDYYKGTEAEAYATEMNDQKEVTEKYDPNYEQQYDNVNQELERQQYDEGQLYQEQQHYDQQLYEQQQYEQQQPVPQEHEGYNQPQTKLDLQQYEQHNYIQQEVEQRLDTEEGYVQQDQQQVLENVAQYLDESLGPEKQLEESVNVEKPEAGEILTSEQMMG